MRKHDLVYQRIKLESQAEYIASEKARAQGQDDAKMFDILNTLHFELLSCLAEVNEGIALLEDREKVK